MVKTEPAEMPKPSCATCAYGVCQWRGLTYLDEHLKTYCVKRDLFRKPANVCDLYERKGEVNTEGCA